MHQTWPVWQTSESYCSLRPDSALEPEPTSLRHTWSCSVWDKRELLQSHSGFSSETEPTSLRHIWPMLLQYHYRLIFETEPTSFRYIWPVCETSGSCCSLRPDSALKQSLQASDIIFIWPMLPQYHYRLSFETEHISHRYTWPVCETSWSYCSRRPDSALKQSIQASDIIFKRPILLQYYYRLSFKTEPTLFKHTWPVCETSRSYCSLRPDSALKQSP